MIRFFGVFHGHPQFINSFPQICGQKCGKLGDNPWENPKPACGQRWKENAKNPDDKKDFWGIPKCRKHRAAVDFPKVEKSSDVYKIAVYPPAQAGVSGRFRVIFKENNSPEAKG
ncbi:MAG: hypothetical protein J6M47_02200 [Clostridia bacterium]|nr:hypothetical protein [Clostridia bacterium]